MDQGKKLNRRNMIFSAMALSCGFNPIKTRAHAGHGALRVTAEAKVISVTGSVVELQIDLLNLTSTSQSLIGVEAEGARYMSFPEPVLIAGFGGTRVRVSLSFSEEVPSIFTVFLDFGDHGRGPVLVVR